MYENQFLEGKNVSLYPPERLSVPAISRTEFFFCLKRLRFFPFVFIQQPPQRTRGKI